MDLPVVKVTRGYEDDQMAVNEQTNRETTAKSFHQAVVRSQGEGLFSAEALSTVQVNVGLKCNLTCRHCHVNSSPHRKETMDWPTMEAVVRLAKTLRCDRVDITGGAPEMNPNFKRLVRALRDEGFAVMVRTNLTIIDEEGYTDLPEFYSKHKVDLVASLPCYTEENVDAQRGEGVYHDSIAVIKKLNAVGYGVDPALILNLVYNPGGPVLPPSQETLEQDYRRELDERFGIRFTHLYTITNAPIGRFRGDLRRQKRHEEYLNLLRDNFNAVTVESLMCRHQISVDWDGALYDCDFNLALRWPLSNGTLFNVRSLDPVALLNRKIITGDHCFACTAGCGSSCSGALA